MVLKELGTRVLWTRARDYLNHYKPLVIGVAGTSDRTITKHAIALALQDDARVRVAEEGYSSKLGVALALLGLKGGESKFSWVKLLANSRLKEIKEEEPEIIIIELAARRPGDIDWITRHVSFGIGAVTRIGSSHLEYFIKKEMVSHEHMSLPASLAESGVAVLNSDDEEVLKMKDHLNAKTILVGESGDADVRLVRVSQLGRKGYACEIEVGGRQYECMFPELTNRQQIVAPLIAIAVWMHVQKNKKPSALQEVLQRLKSLKPPSGYLNSISTESGATILDGSAGADPEYVLAGLDALQNISGKRRIAIIGDILELGGQSTRWHERIGRRAAKVADVFVAVGTHMRHAQEMALTSSQEVDTHHFDDSRDVSKWFRGYLREGDVVLVTGSRSMKMNRIVERLRK